MTFWLALRRVLPLLAVLSLALTPVTASAAAAGIHMSMTAHASPEAGPSMNHADMDGCPSGKAAQQNPSKTQCPLMALCLASVASVLPAVLSVPVPVATRSVTTWPDVAPLASVHGPSLPDPPRA